MEALSKRRKAPRLTRNENSGLRLNDLVGKEKDF